MSAKTEAIAARRVQIEAAHEHERQSRADREAERDTAKLSRDETVSAIDALRARFNGPF